MYFFHNTFVVSLFLVCCVCHGFSNVKKATFSSLLAGSYRTKVFNPFRSCHLPSTAKEIVFVQAVANSNEIDQTPSIFSERFWMKKDLPNKLTISRIAAIPLFILSFLLRKRATSVIIFILTCLTDFLDGYLARRWKIVSPFGAFLDPVADKLMVATAMIMLTSLYPTAFYVVPVVIILCREIAISALREWMAERGNREIVKVGMMGKIKTALQMISTVCLLTVFPDQSTDIDLCRLFGWSKPFIFMTGLVLLYVSTVAAVVSGYQYFRAALPKLFSETFVKMSEAEEASNM